MPTTEEPKFKYGDLVKFRQTGYPMRIASERYKLFESSSFSYLCKQLTWDETGQAFEISETSIVKWTDEDQRRFDQANIKGSDARNTTEI